MASGRLVMVPLLVALAGCGTTAPSSPPPATSTVPVASSSAASSVPPTSSASPPSPTPTASLRSTDLILSGAIRGRLASVTASCNQEEQVGGRPHVFQYVAATGRLAGDQVNVWVFDPAGPGEYESAMHLIVFEIGADGRLLSKWDRSDAAGVTAFNLKDGATLSSNLNPDLTTQGRGEAQSDELLTVEGRIVCR